jgi:ABC-2 type transport system ATP-binding protein
MVDHVIEAKGLTRWFGSRCVCSDVSFRVPRGSVFALVGRNGAGKSTAIRMLLGLLEPTRGKSSILGHDSRSLPPEVRARIGYLAESHPVYPRMTVAQHESFQAHYFPRWKKETFARVCSDFRIDGKTKAGDLSRGQRAGMCLGLTLAADPELLVLDDPSLGLDPVARRAFLEAVIEFTHDKDRTVVFSSHLLTDIERVADYITVLDEGMVRACCSVDTFLRNVRRYALRFEGEPPALAPFPGLLAVAALNGELRVTAVDLPPEVREMARSVEELPMNLEDSVLAYIGQRRSQRGGAQARGGEA